MSGRGAFPLFEPATTAIKAAVQASDFDTSAKSLHAALSAAGFRWKTGAAEGAKEDTSEQDETVALAFRVVLEELVVNSNKSVTGGGAIKDPKVVALLDLSLHAAHQGWVAKQLPFMCVHELFEGQTARRCGDAFAYLEQRVEKLKDLLDDTKGDSKFVQAALLRCCNTLMQRLSKSTDLLLCGRVLMFLSHVLPLSEKSGVNLKGEYNKGNVTEYQEMLDREEAERMQAEGATEKTFKLRSTDEKLDGQMEVRRAPPAPRRAAPNSRKLQKWAALCVQTFRLQDGSDAMAEQPGTAVHRRAASDSPPTRPRRRTRPPRRAAPPLLRGGARPQRSGGTALPSPTSGPRRRPAGLLPPLQDLLGPAEAPPRPLPARQRRARRRRRRIGAGPCPPPRPPRPLRPVFVHAVRPPAGGERRAVCSVSPTADREAGGRRERGDGR